MGNLQPLAYRRGSASAALEQLPELLRERQTEQTEQVEPTVAEAPTQAEPTPTNTAEETVQKVEPPSAPKPLPEQTVTSNSEDEPTATEKPEVSPLQAPTQAKQPEQTTQSQGAKASQAKPKPQAKPEDWHIYNSALKRGQAYQARANKAINDQGCD